MVNAGKGHVFSRIHRLAELFALLGGRTSNSQNHHIYHVHAIQIGTSIKHLIVSSRCIENYGNHCVADQIRKSPKAIQVSQQLPGHLLGLPTFANCESIPVVTHYKI